MNSLIKKIDNVKEPVMPMRNDLLVCYVPYSINGVWSKQYCHDILQASEFFMAVKKHIASKLKNDQKTI